VNALQPLLQDAVPVLLRLGERIVRRKSQKPAFLFALGHSRLWRVHKRGRQKFCQSKGYRDSCGQLRRIVGSNNYRESMQSATQQSSSARRSVSGLRAKTGSVSEAQTRDAANHAPNEAW
jgi:hypothetical protein